MNVREWDARDNTELIKWTHQDPKILGNFGFTEKPLDGDIGLYLVKRLWDGRSVQFAVEDDEGSLMAFGSADNIHPDGSAFGNVIVAPQYRGKGYWIIKAMAKVLKDMGLKRLIATIDPDNELSTRVQKKIGFRPPKVDILCLDLEGMEV